MSLHFCSHFDMQQQTYGSLSWNGPTAQHMFLRLLPLMNTMSS